MDKFLNFITALAQRTSSEDPLQQYKFRVSIPGIPTTIGFQKVSGLSEEIEVVEYYESAYEYTHKLPGKSSVGEITMERGMFEDDSLGPMVKQVMTSGDFRTTIIIQLCDRFNNPKRTWKLAEAWVSKWESSDFDTGSTDVAIETITVQFEYFL